MTKAQEPAALEGCLDQLHRTSAWLRTLPLARFAHDEGAVERQARGLITRVAACVQSLCQAMRDLAHRSEGNGDIARDVLHADCPPADAVPDHLAVHALGDQLAVHADDLARCGRMCLDMPGALPVGEMDAIAALALRLRSRG